MMNGLGSFRPSTVVASVGMEVGRFGILNHVWDTHTGMIARELFHIACDQERVIDPCRGPHDGVG